MPQIIRHALAERIQILPVFRALIEDISEATGVPVRFLPGPAPAIGGAGPEVAPLCARLAGDAEGCRLCGVFRQNLREEAAEGPATGVCDAGLWEAMVPVAIGGQAVGHLLLSGCAAEVPTATSTNRARHLLGRAGVSLDPGALALLRGQSPVVGPRRREALVSVLRLAADRLRLLLTEHLVTKPSALPAPVARACAIVHAEYALELRLSALAERLGVSEGHFSRSFHHATGLRFVEYLARYRAGRARALLVGERCSVAEIARACGFRSLSQFNRVFRAVHGVSPRSVRKAAAASAVD
ncbi:MAG: helix-turn-helix domain-containing protein [Verrucomicrobiota bacterium]